MYLVVHRLAFWNMLCSKFCVHRLEFKCTCWVNKDFQNTYPVQDILVYYVHPAEIFMTEHKSRATYIHDWALEF